MVSNVTAIRFDWTYATALVGRACLSAIFLISGVSKLVSPGTTVAAIESVGLPFAQVGLALAVAIELVCGAALVAGFKVRWSAGILAAFTVTTAIFFHSAFADPNQFTHFLKNIAITGGLLLVLVFGRNAVRS